VHRCGADAVSLPACILEQYVGGKSRIIDEMPILEALWLLPRKLQRQVPGGVNENWFLDLADARRKIGDWEWDYDESRPHRAGEEASPALNTGRSH